MGHLRRELPCGLQVLPHHCLLCLFQCQPRPQAAPLQHPNRSAHLMLMVPLKQCLLQLHALFPWAQAILPCTLQVSIPACRCPVGNSNYFD